MSYLLVLNSSSEADKAVAFYEKGLSGINIACAARISAVLQQLSLDLPIG
jgi:hypothetical protein